MAELCHYFVIDRVRTAIEIFKEGLATLSILETMQKHPTAFRKIFCHSERLLTSEDVDQAFKPQLDEPGSNNRIKQETAVMNWRDFLQNCEGRLSALGNFSNLFVLSLKMYCIVILHNIASLPIPHC